VEWNIDQYPNITETDHLTLTCRKSYQLLDIAVVAGTEILDEEDEDFKTVKVFGYTPSLVVNTNLCYWNRGCIISFPRDAMFSCVSIINSTDKSALIRPNEEFSQASCFLQNVEFLRPVHAKCVADKRMYEQARCIYITIFVIAIKKIYINNFYMVKLFLNQVIVVVDILCPQKTTTINNNDKQQQHSLPKKQQTNRQTNKQQQNPKQTKNNNFKINKSKTKTYKREKKIKSKHTYFVF
jgi:hypothetical protein